MGVYDVGPKSPSGLNMYCTCVCSDSFETEGECGREKHDVVADIETQERTSAVRIRPHGRKTDRLGLPCITKSR